MNLALIQKIIKLYEKKLDLRDIQEKIGHKLTLEQLEYVTNQIEHHKNFMKLEGNSEMKISSEKMKNSLDMIANLKEKGLSYIEESRNIENCNKGEKIMNEEIERLQKELSETKKKLSKYEEKTEEEKIFEGKMKQWRRMAGFEDKEKAAKEEQEFKEKIAKMPQDFTVSKEKMIQEKREKIMKMYENREIAFYLKDFWLQNPLLTKKEALEEMKKLSNPDYNPLSGVYSDLNR